MNSRRKFLRNTGLTTGVMMLFDPFKLLAEAAAPVAGRGKVNNLIFLHTNNNSGVDYYKTAVATATLKSGSENIILLNAGDYSASLFNTGNSSNYSIINEAGYDAVLADKKDANNMKEIMESNVPLVAPEGGFTEPSRIINKGNIKVGIIGTAAFKSSHNTLAMANALARELKAEKGCNLVICISSLGYNAANNIDDLNLAKKSENIDIIISANNKERIPAAVVLNKLGHEVFIDNAGGRQSAIGKIEIGFDTAGKKNFIKTGTETLPEVSLS